MKTQTKQSRILQDQGGFTLLELVVVIAILSTMAWMSLEMVGNNTDQVRFDDTRNRLETIRKAIIGDPSRTVNGTPFISGYVADMGNFPETLADLVVQGSQPDYGYDEKYGLWSGWRGPYLRATSVLDLDEVPKFRDGWGNKAEDGTEDDANFGWQVDNGADSTEDFPEYEVHSLGRDGSADSEDDAYDVYNADYPPSDYRTLVAQNDYTVLVTNSSGNGGIPVNFGTPAKCWVCDGVLAGDRAACVAGGGSWKGYKYDFQGNEITSWASCRDDVNVGGDNDTDDTADPIDIDGDGTNDAMDVDGDGNPDGLATFLPISTISEPVCLKIAYRSEGDIEALKPVTPCGDGTSVNAADCSAYTWDTDYFTRMTLTWDGATNQSLFFRFVDNTRLPMGQLAYKIYEYDDTGGTAGGCTDDEFAMTPGVCTTSGGSVLSYYTYSDCKDNGGDTWEDAEPWQTFTLVPGATLTQPLEWKVE